jgi:hypothetical protein
MAEAYVEAQAVRWVGDEPFPGVVEVELTDADGREWRFVDKSAIFDRDSVLGPSARYPISLRIACTVVERGEDRVVISTAEPWGVESVERQSEFVVRPDQLAVAEA